MRVIALSILLPAVLWGANIMNGYFRFDDFEILRLAGTQPLVEQLFRLHGDHAMPLFRIEMVLARTLFGVDPFFYNLGMLVVFTSVFVSSVLLLRACSFSERTQVTFLLVLCSWHAWGALITGYYVLSVYLQAIVFGQVALLFYIRWYRSSQVINLVGCFVAQLAAVMIDTAGLIVLPSVLCFSMGFSVYESGSKGGASGYIRKNAGFLMVWVSVVLCYAIFHYVTFHVKQPDGFLNMRGNEGSNALVSFARDVFMILAKGHWGSLPGLNLAYPVIRFPSLRLAMAMVAMGASFVLLFRYRKAPQFPIIVYICLVVLGSAAFAAIGRPGSHDPKHINFGHVHYAMLTAIVLCGLLDFLPNRVRTAFKAFGVCLFLVNPLVAIDFQRTAVLRATKIQRFVEQLSSEWADTILGCGNVRNVPLLSGEAVYSKFGYLLSRYDVGVYVDFFDPQFQKIKLIRDVSVVRNDSGEIVLEGPGSIVDMEGFLACIKQSPLLQDYYLYQERVSLPEPFP